MICRSYLSESVSGSVSVKLPFYSSTAIIGETYLERSKLNGISECCNAAVVFSTQLRRTLLKRCNRSLQHRTSTMLANAPSTRTESCYGRLELLILIATSGTSASRASSVRNTARKKWNGRALFRRQTDQIRLLTALLITASALTLLYSPS